MPILTSKTHLHAVVPPFHLSISHVLAGPRQQQPLHRKQIDSFSGLADKKRCSRQITQQHRGENYLAKQLTAKGSSSLAGRD